MVWLIVAALLGWCFYLQVQLGSLREQVSRLTDGLAAGGSREVTAAASSPPPAVFAGALDPTPAPAERERAAPQVEQETVTPVEDGLVTVVAALWAETAPEPEVAADRPPAGAAALGSQRSAGDWLSENGLAWIGGGALALGGLLLVAYSAQRGFFTPGLRIAAAGLVGAVALAAGEILRRGWRGRLEANLLVASLTTAAGAAILYATVWAASQLYGFIPGAAAAAGLAAISLGLLALALMHGEALGILAIAAAYAAPLVSGAGDWRGGPLDAYVVLILATGLAACGLRRWTGTGAAALAGAGLWALGRAIAEDRAGVALVASLAPGFALAAILRGSVGDAFRRRPLTDLLAAAAMGASMFAALLWLDQDPGAGAAPTLVTLATGIAVALGVRYARVNALMLIPPAIATALGGAIASAARPSNPHALWLTPAIATVAVAGFDAAWRSDRRREAALVGAAGAALCLTLAAPALARAAPDWDWAIDAIFAGLFALGAARLGGRDDDATGGLAAGAWIAAAAGAAGLAVHAGLDPRAAAAAYGLLGVVLAGLAVRVGWRGFAETAAAAGLAAFAALLGSDIAGKAVGGAMAWPLVAVIGASVTGAQTAAWVVLGRRVGVPGSREALSTLAVMTALTTAFLSLQAMAAPPGGGAGLDPFTLAALRTLLLLVAGLMLSIRGAATTLGQARGPALLAIGAVHGLLLQGLWLHPWWGRGGPVTGPPLVDSLLLGLCVPSVLLGLAARQRAPAAASQQVDNPWLGLFDLAAALGLAARRLGLRGATAARACWTAALTFLTIWVASELRRLFHGPALDGAGFGYAETAAYGAAVLAGALGLERFARRTNADAAGSWNIVDAGAWLAMGLALWLLVLADSPWWGPLDGDLRSPALLGAILAGACGLSATLALTARRSGRPILAHAALVAGGLEAFAWLTLAVRYAFHGGAMRAPLREASLETWTFSAVWALFGLVVLGFAASRRDPPLRWLALAILLGTTLKVFLFDMARLEGVVRAASFLALGVVLLVGALAARRLGAAGSGGGDPA